MAVGLPRTIIPPSHWSAAFVEHLRTVHFALIATAAALVVVALTTKQFSTEVANYELHRLLDMKRRWGADFLRNEFGNVTDVAGTQKQLLDALGKGFDIRLSPLENDVARNAIRQTTITDECCFVQDDLFEDLPANINGISAHAKFPLEMVYLRTASDSFSKSAAKSVPLMPDSLPAIESFWKILDRTNVEYYFPMSIGELGVVTEGDEEVRGKVQFSILKERGVTEQFLFSEDEERAQKHPIQMQLEPTYALEDLQGHQRNVVLQFTGIYPVRRSSAQTFKFHAVVTQYVYVELNGSRFAEYLGVKSPKFNRAFYDLLQVADRNGVYTLKELEENLSKAGVSEAPVFEAFGVKFPADLAILGGTLALLSVQLYFFVYLRKLSGSLKPDDPGWDVPWIGMDTSAVSRIIFIITASVLPVLSLVVLGAETSLRRTRIYWDFLDGVFHHDPFKDWSWSVRATIFGMLISVALSGYLGYLSWKYRPSIEDEPEAAMLNPPA
jgi:hypothetical protein